MDELINNLNNNIGFNNLMSKLNLLVNRGVWHWNMSDEDNINLINMISERINSTRLIKEESKNDFDIEIDQFTQRHRNIFKNFCFQLRSNNINELNNNNNELNINELNINEYNVENFIRYIETTNSLDELIYILVNANDNGHTWNFHNNWVYYEQENRNLIILVKNKINRLRFEIIEENGMQIERDIFTSRYKQIFYTFCKQLKHIGSRL